MRRLWFMLLPFLMVSSLWAKENVRLKEVVVTATRVEESIEDIAQDVSVITKKEIASGSYRDISEVLRNVTGLNLLEYGNRGSSATLSLRGSTSEQALVLIDGKRLNKPGDGLVDLNAISIPLENIERIEVLRGASSAIYGADAMGGVINIITKIPDETVIALTGSYGRFVTRDLNFNASGKFKEVGYYLSLSKESSDGFLPNSDYDMYAVNSKFRVNISKDISADITVDYNHKDAGSPGAVTWPTPFADQTDEALLAGITLTIKETVLKLYSHNSRITYINPGSEDNTHKNHVNGLELQHSLSIGSSNLITGGFEILEEDINSRDNMNTGNSIGEHSRTRKGIFLQDEISIYEKAILTLGARYDDIDSHNRISPKGSLLIKFPNQTNVSFSAGRGFRVPAMNALYWPDTGWAVGNPDLKPETSTEYECIFRKFFGNRGDIKLVAFEKRAEDLIQWQEITGIWSPVNVSKTRIRGFETEGKIHINRADVGLSYTFMDPQDITADKKIRFSTRHQIKGTASVYPAKDTVISLEWSYVTNYVVKKGDPDCYFLLDGKLSRKIKLSKGTAEIFIIGKNILNRDFEIVTGYPMPPVQFSGGIRFSF